MSDLHAGRGPAVGSTTVLVVDDDFDIREALSEFLAGEGYVVTSVANGREALAHLRAQPSTSVVLLDLMMPVMDGFQFRAEQKRDPVLVSIPVVVMTARGSLENLALDVQDIFPKPLDLDRLIEAIERAASRSDTASPE